MNKYNVPNEILLKIFNFLPDYQTRYNFYSVVKRVNRTKRNKKLKKLVDGQFQNPLIKRLTAKGYAFFKKENSIYMMQMIDGYLLYFLYGEKLEIIDITSGNIIYTIPFELFGNDVRGTSYTFRLYMDNQENKHYLRFTKTIDSMFYRIFEYVPMTLDSVIYIDLDKCEVTSEDKMGIDMYDMSYNNECPLCKKSSNKCGDEYFTLIEEQHRYKLIVSKESMKCSCDDSSDDFY
jgi:hypothetical protein